MDVDILELDVLVLDSKQRPVAGLTKDDFEVLIARAVQPIEGFEGPPAPGLLAPPAERIAGTTVPVQGNGRATQHVLFYFDLEELPRESIRKAAEVIPPILASVPPPVRFSVAAQYGRSSVLAWDEEVLDRATSQMETLDATVSADFGDGSASGTSPATSGMGRGAPVENPRNYERRQYDRAMARRRAPQRDANRKPGRLRRLLAPDPGVRRRRAAADAGPPRGNAPRLPRLRRPRRTKDARFRHAGLRADAGAEFPRPRRRRRQGRQHHLVRAGGSRRRSSTRSRTSRAPR